MTLYSTNYTVIIMISSVSGLDEPNLCCDWLPERSKRRYPARSGSSAVSRKKTVTKLVWSTWLDIGLVQFYMFIDQGRAESNTLKKRTSPISSHRDCTLGQ